MEIKRVMDLYSSLSSNNLDTLSEVYHEEINFIDPLHEIHGLESLELYFSGLYENVTSCQFEFLFTQQSDRSAFLTWVMHLKHPKLNRHRTIHVNGCTHLQFEGDKVIYHRDYFDAGQMLYRQLPVLGSVLRRIDARAVK
ncbi:nuclear transport factor 2 family protein [Vibrio sp. SCSIO 43136]|uniref:nuclear transport factor 2 family protein n=1 Tax=Vibrio sp. SCSIO 43136 TaxID=2819101 RepID=UPI002075BCB3|nr:nuclear transport factor 2 family protein [Vibrio sp. SCSIO 43136]USD64369.1 nuclear transport factor 2 family protein [Vibrio sp. SCSIO 43136]